MKQNPFPIKKIVLLVIAFSIVFNLKAQKKVNHAKQSNIEIYKNKTLLMKRAGTIITLAGVSTAITGIYIYTNSEDYDEYSMTLGTNLFLGGATITCVGIPLWIIGGIRKSKGMIALKKFDINTDNYTAVGLGLGLTLRF
jgi:hypothetical protein